MAILITTTVSLDIAKSEGQVTLNIVQGDAGTRRLKFVPISGGQVVSLYDVASAKVCMYHVGIGYPLVIDCTIENGAIYLVPTAAMVATPGEFRAELVLISNGDTATTYPFTISIHEKVFDGDAVEHTNTTLMSAEFASNGNLVLHLADGTDVVALKWVHSHDLATTSADGFLSHDQFDQLETLATQVDQDLRTTNTDGPTFYAATIGAVTIAHDGTVTGLKFT